MTVRRPLRVLIVTEYARPWPGGIPEHVFHTRAQLESRGHTVTVLTGPGPSADDPPRTVRLRHAIAFDGNGARSRMCLDARLVGLSRWLRVLAPDVLHVHAPLDPCLALAAVLASPVPVVGTFHASFEPSLAWSLLYGQPLARRAWRKLAVRTAVSDEAARCIQRYFPEPLRRTPNGVDTTRFAPAESRARDDVPTVLFVGRPDPRKGLDVALHAFTRIRATIPDVRLRLVGVTRSALAAQGMPTHGVEALGECPSETMPEWFRRAHVLVAPSRFGESQGVVLLEGMASGLPVVASRIGGYTAVIHDGIDGRLVPPGDPEALATAVLHWLRSPAEAERVGRAAREASLSWDWRHVVDALEATLYEAAHA